MCAPPVLPPQVLDPLTKAALQAAFPCTDPDDPHVVAMAAHQQALSDDAARASILRSTLLPDALSDERDKELHMKESKEKMAYKVSLANRVEPRVW